ncbi:MAG: class I SAM-dependent methyltransferase [Acidimicrobiales bacterium]
MSLENGGAAGAYGQAMADIYDEWFAAVSDVTATVKRIVGWLQNGPPGPVLELGIGTGRVALPLAAAGVDVFGVDASPAMLARLRAKPGGADLPVTLADMAGPEPSGPFALVLVAYNTLFNLTTAEAQQQCISNAAARLMPGGRLVIEAFVPDPGAPASEEVTIRSADPEGVVVSVSRHHPATQTADGEYVEVSATDVIRRPWRILYATTDQLDTMATRAGLTKEGRWADWSDAPFSPDSNHHVTSFLQLDRYSG